MISFVIEVSKSCAFYDSGVDKTMTGVGELKQFDTVLLSDGRTGAITDIFPPDGLYVDVGYSPLSWDNIVCKIEDVVKVLSAEEYSQIEKKVYDEHPEELQSYLALFDENERESIRREIMQGL